MTEWLVISLALLAGTVPCFFVCVRRSVVDGAVALTLAGVLAPLTLLSLSEYFARSIYLDVAIVLAVLSLAATLAFARFLERWL